MTYYHHVRREIEYLLPKSASRILDVGAGAGVTLNWLKSLYPSSETTGTEINFELKAELMRNADVAIIDSIDDCLPQLKTYDLILLLDVLEHLPDSLGTLKKVSKLLEPGGHVIVSVPNVAHLSVAIPLLFRRRFTYRDSGILDRTHVRFFVEETAVGLLNDADLIVTDGVISGLQGARSKVLDRLSVGLLRHHLAKQYIMLAEPGDHQQPVRWMVA
jgi:2-polyprenyl-3-methyl-5-hydroxy-6-metoxy-1,4-benzoquinol methylase